MVNTGFNRAFGSGLRRFISRSTSNRFKAAGSGVCVALILQSSTAAALIVSSFAGRGIITISGAIAVMLGADIGTTLAAQILTFDLSWLIPVMVSVGFVINKIMKDSQNKHIGRAMIGLGLVLTALKMIVQTSEPFRESEAIQVILTSLTTEPFLAVLLAAVLTWLVHSSLAMVLLFVSLISSGVVSLELGFVFILGANLGGALAPVIMTMSENQAGRRVPVANLMMRIFAVMCVFPFIEMAEPYLREFNPDPARMMVNFHTVFNVGLALFFLPFIGLVSYLTKEVVPKDQIGEHKHMPRYLDRTALSTPPAALACAARETLRVSDNIQRMLRDSMEAFKQNDMTLINKVCVREDVVDKLYSAIKKYMGRMSGEGLDETESRRYMQVLSFATNLEHVGDVIEKNLMDMAAKKVKNKSRFSDEGLAEIIKVHAAVMQNLVLAQNIFMSGDLGMARKLLEAKSNLRNLEREASASHLERFRAGVAETVATSSIHLDILRDLRRINSYLTMIAYPILEDAGHLRSSPLKKSKGNEIEQI